MCENARGAHKISNLYEPTGTVYSELRIFADTRIMAPSKGSYDAEWRRNTWNKIPPEKRAEISLRLKQLFQIHRTLTINEMATYMGMAKWRVYMALAPLLDEEKVYALNFDDRELPTKLVYWEDYVEGDAIA